MKELWPFAAASNVFYCSNEDIAARLCYYHQHYTSACYIKVLPLAVIASPCNYSKVPRVFFSQCISRRQKKIPISILHVLQRFTCTQGRDALQLIHSEDGTLVSRYPTCKFPSPHLTKALLRVGADVTAHDNDGNTALHLAALSRPWRPDLAIALLDAGAHLDTVNKDGSTFQMLLCDKRRYDSIYPVKYITLACLAARVIKKTQIIKVPAHLRTFVEMH